jgi:5-methylcytosine-specific restriction endonuclease McrA
MRSYSLTHVGDHDLLHNLKTLAARDRCTTAEMLAHIAEVDTRRLYLPDGYPSMFLYCVHELGFSEDAAYKRIQAARAARQFPEIFEAVADGRLHLTAVGLLAPHLTRANAEELLAAASHQTKSAIEELIARRFPRSEMLPLVEVIPASPANDQPAPRPVEDVGPEHVREFTDQLAPAQVEVAAPRSKVTPISADQSGLYLSMSRRMRDKLRYARELVSHEIPSGDPAAVLECGLDALIETREKRKFAATTRPRRRPRETRSRRHVPAQVKRAVWERDGGQCTFVSKSGRRCAARTMLEFDHVDPVARGGRATVAGIRLRCRAHNQYEAERVFGAGFMEEKRENARRAKEARARAAAEAQAQSASLAKERANEVIPYLRRLGFNADVSRRAAEYCESIPDAPLEERVRRALSYFRPPSRTVSASQPMTSSMLQTGA